MSWAVVCHGSVISVNSLAGSEVITLAVEVGEFKTRSEIEGDLLLQASAETQINTRVTTGSFNNQN